MVAAALHLLRRLRVDRGGRGRKCCAALRPIGMRGRAARHRATRRREDQAKRRQLELALEQARFEAARAQRQFDAVDPDNRLVAAELERRWNERLAERLAASRRRSTRWTARQAPSLTPQNSARHYLPWAPTCHALGAIPAAGNEARKRILRAVIKEIVASVAEARIELVIHWQGGDHTALNVVKNRLGQHRWTTDVEVQALIPQLARQLNDASIASLLNRLGHRTGKGQSWTEMRVRSFRCDRGIAGLQGRRARGSGRADARTSRRRARYKQDDRVAHDQRWHSHCLAGLQGCALGHQGQRTQAS